MRNRDYDSYPGAERYEWTKIKRDGGTQRLEIYPRLGVWRVFIRLPGMKKEHLVIEKTGLGEHFLILVGEWIASQIDGGSHGFFH